MFRHYLTYQFALSFHQLCLCTPISAAPLKNRLLRSAEQMIQAFTKSLHARLPREEGLHLVTATLNLRDCREILDEAGAFSGELKTKFEILHQRIEQITESVARSQGGQLQMLG